MILQRPRLSDQANGAGAAILMLWAAGALAILLRLFLGLGATTNLSDATPWGLWIGFDVMCGVALAAGGFVMAGIGLRLRPGKVPARSCGPAILTAFLGYMLVIFGLFLDIGQPWRIWHPLYMWNTALGAARGGLVRHAVHDRARPGVQPGGPGALQAGKTPLEYRAQASHRSW